ncbi:lantibiotic immunity ABC transporter MutG family permease subunit [Lysinibacillus irui]|uniref:Lantibiotic immunity ABC transporter MutG family permease subunit n=1 Tax=Lysinibacillus irui TaxID=2998077 RepID=A0AAJ5UW99_9BACI|nr:lantibiotic immunity ABC transporter MutG family permease subunit [Lysinibacillus irui]WDV07887.1 lantibiotic immunity ABC transporter MutG family permease subunit [Lysinibacillus irui]
MVMLRLLRAECLKTKRTPFLLTHLLVPLIISGIFLAYYTYSPWDFQGKVTAYFQGLACGLPIIIGLVCAMASEQEANAGHFQVMLATTNRKIMTYMAKLLLLLLFSLGAIFLSIAIFSIGFIELLHEVHFDYSFYSMAACILFGSHVIIYILHLFVSLQFGKGASIGLGIVEALLVALLLTGLGDSIWPFLPYGWSGHFISLWIIKSVGMDITLLEASLRHGIIACIGGILVTFILSCLWFWKWEGRASEH